METCLGSVTTPIQFYMEVAKYSYHSATIFLVSKMNNQCSTIFRQRVTSPNVIDSALSTDMFARYSRGRGFNTLKVTAHLRRSATSIMSFAQLYMSDPTSLSIFLARQCNPEANRCIQVPFLKLNCSGYSRKE